MVVLWLALACGTSEPEVPLSPPWNEYGFSTSGAEVKENRPEELHVVYSGFTASGPAQLRDYGDKLERAGWVLEEERSGMGMAWQTRKRGDMTLSLLVSQQGKQVDVVLDFE